MSLSADIGSGATAFLGRATAETPASKNLRGCWGTWLWMSVGSGMSGQAVGGNEEGYWVNHCAGEGTGSVVEIQEDLAA